MQTDAEVCEVLNSSLYTNNAIPTCQELDKSMKNIHSKIYKLRKIFQEKIQKQDNISYSSNKAIIVSDTLTCNTTTNGSSDSSSSSSSSSNDCGTAKLETEYKEKNVLENEITNIQLELYELNVELRILQEQEQYAWCIDTTRNYLSNRPGWRQTSNTVEFFFKKLSELNQLHNFDIVPHEALQLINHRPTLHVDIQLFIEHFYERIRSPINQQIILDLCDSLPIPPSIDNTINYDTNRYDTNIKNVVNENIEFEQDEAMELDDIINQDNYINTVDELVDSNTNQINNMEDIIDDDIQSDDS